MEVLGSLSFLFECFMRPLRIIKFTTCLALKVFNALVFHLSFSLSPRVPPTVSLSGNLLHKISCSISDVCHCNCHTNMPVPSRQTLISSTSHPILWALYPHLYSLRQQIMISTPEFTSPFTGHLQAFQYYLNCSSRLICFSTQISLLQKDLPRTLLS